MSSSTKLTNKNDLITPATFQKLHPVHYQIFDVLKKTIPATLIQTCHKMYQELIPKVYERVTINGIYYNSITGGANVVFEESGCWCEDCEDCDWYSSYINDVELWCTNLPDLKSQALSHTKFLSFTDCSGVHQFIADNEICYSRCCTFRGITLEGIIFPNIHHLHLGKDIVTQQVVNLVFGRDNLGDDSCYSNDKFLDILFNDRTPHTICIDWPEDWKPKDWVEYREEGDDGHWALDSGMMNFLLEFAENMCIKHIIVHLEFGDLSHVKSSLEEITKGSNLTLYIKKTSSKIQLFHIIDHCWQHFHTLSRSYQIRTLPITYSLYPLRGLKKELEKFEETVEQDDMDLFFLFLERLEIRKKRCECKE